LPSAVAHFGRAIDAFERLGESENEAVLRSFRAFSLFDLGRDREAEADLLRAASMRSHLSTYDSLEIVLDSWLALLVTPRFPELADQFQDQLISAARESGRASMLSQALLVRGENTETSLEDRLRYLADARTAAIAITEERERRRKEALIAIAKARALLPGDPAASLTALDEGMSFYADSEFQHLRLEALVVRASALLSTGDRVEAERAHREGIALLEAALGQAPTFRDRHGLMREARTLFDGLAELRLATGTDPEAIRVVVRRARALSFARPAEHHGSPRRYSRRDAVPPDGITLLEYAVIGDDVRVWTTSGEHTSFVSLEIDLEELVSKKARFEKALRADRNDDAAALSRELGAILLGTLRNLPLEPLWIVPAPELFDLGWPALQDPVRDAPLGAARELTLLPYFDSERSKQWPSSAVTARREVRLVGAPRVVADSMPLLELAAVEPEIDRIRLLHPNSRVLLNDYATPSAVLLRPTPRVLHVAAHALPGRGVDFPPRLALAPDPAHPSGFLDGFEIADADLSGVEIVLLPACESSRGLSTRTEAPFSLASAFLAAGARSVVATSWPVDDRAAAGIMLRLHREFLAGHTTAKALRRTLETSREELPARPSIWAAFAVWSVGAPVHRKEEKQ
jgi:CHAT domain-containing protein